MFSSCKLVDGSSRLGVSSSDVIDTKEKLFALLRTHLEKLFKDKSDDEKLFWATYSYYRVNVDDDQIVLCSNLASVFYPIEDVSVEKSDLTTSICVTPYKIDHLEEETLTRLEAYKPGGSTVIKPLDVLGWEEDLEQKWEGQIWIRTGYTGWNCVNARIDIEF